MSQETEESEFGDQIANGSQQEAHENGLMELNRTFNKVLAKLKSREKEVQRLRLELHGSHDKIEVYSSLLEAMKKCQEELFSVKNQLTDTKSDLELVRIERNTLEKKVEDLEAHLETTIEHMKLDKNSSLTDEKRKHNQSVKTLQTQNEMKLEKLQTSYSNQVESRDNEISDLKRKLAKVEMEKVELEKKISTQKCVSDACKAEKAHLKQYYKQAQENLEEELQRAKKRTKAVEESPQIKAKKAKTVSFSEKTEQEPVNEMPVNEMPESTGKKSILKSSSSRPHRKLFIDKFLPKPFSGDFANKWKN